MKMYIYLVSFLLLFLNFSCNGSVKENESGNQNYEKIVRELSKRNYDVEVNSHKGIKSYVTAHPKTLLMSNDLINICKLPNLRNLRIDNANLSIDFFDHLENCDLSSLSLFSLENIPWKDGIICSLSKKRKTQEYLYLDNTNFSDHDMGCISNFESIMSLGFHGPAHKFSEEAFCKLMQSGVKLDSFHLTNIDLSKKEFNCLLDLKNIDVFVFKKIKGRSASDMQKLEQLYFKKNGRKVLVEVFGYDSP
ncbi:hypothetical protein EHQ47_13975 [Leptospira bourretii]|uniref:hypothetical protein n=1 Tax=Leptospira bourretii TaxID=2484962 RepID=UPI0011043D35|nr:hypothetical protein [Leptospira bourretii]TGL20640.1 hypothetical protein EHQ47_13975 [Leptospira bourretii]